MPGKKSRKNRKNRVKSCKNRVNCVKVPVKKNAWQQCYHATTYSAPLSGTANNSHIEVDLALFHKECFTKSPLDLLQLCFSQLLFSIKNQLFTKHSFFLDLNPIVMSSYQIVYLKYQLGVVNSLIQVIKSYFL